MNAIKDAFRKAFEPTLIIKVENLSTGSISSLLTDLHLMLAKKYETMLDAENGVIYLNKRK